MGNKSKLQVAQDETQSAIDETNKKIELLGNYTGLLCDTLNDIQVLFDKIRNVPTKQKFKYEELKKIRLNWKQQVQKIEEDYKKAYAKSAVTGVTGVRIGVTVAAKGSTAAKGIATTYGVVSTSTAISSLSGAVATNAALAWFGGGTLAASSGGMVAGEAFLALAGPVGWAIAGVSLLGSGLMFLKSKSDKKHLEDIFMFISNRDINSYKLAIVEINERISRIIDENTKLKDAIDIIETFGLDYNKMSEKQQYALGSYVNLMNSSTQLLVNPIIGLQPKYSNEDYNYYFASVERNASDELCRNHKDLIISLANFLYKVKLNDRDKKLLWKSLRTNKVLRKSMDISKREFKVDVIDSVLEALDYKYR